MGKRSGDERRESRLAEEVDHHDGEEEDSWALMGLDNMIMMLLWWLATVDLLCWV